MYIVLFLFILAIVAVHLIILQVKKYNELNNIPGPSTIEILKFFLFVRSNEAVYFYIISLLNKYGPVVKVWLKPFRPALIVSDRKYFEHILSTKEYMDRPSAYDLYSGIAGDGLASIKDMSAYKTERKILSPAFSKKAVLSNSQHLIHHVEKLRILLESKENDVVDVQSVINLFTVPIITEYLTKENIGFQEEWTTDIIESLETFQEIYFQRVFSVYKSYDVIFKFMPSYKTWLKCGAKVRCALENVVQNQLAERTEREKVTQDCLDLLCRSNLRHDSVLGHLQTLVLAGYETTAQTMGLALFEMAKRPDVQQLLYKEYVSALGNDKQICVHNMNGMKYTESVIKETMRMHPVAPIIQRRLKSSAAIDDLTIPSGTDMVFVISSLHRSPTYYENPTEFDPERFLPENVSKLQSYAFAPFSCGPRDCIGRKLAMIEMKFMLSYILGHFTVHPVQPEHKLELYGEISLKSKNGIPVIFRRRR